MIPLQDGWLIASIIFFVLLLVLYWRKILTGLTELETIGIVVGIIVGCIPVLEFVFGNDFTFPQFTRIVFGVAAIGIPVGIIFIPRIRRRYSDSSYNNKFDQPLLDHDRPEKHAVGARLESGCQKNII